LEYSPKPLSSADDADRVAQQFGGLYREVLNRTVTKDNVRVKPFKEGRDWTEWRWLLSRFDDLGQPLPVKLHGGGWLLAEQRVGVRESRTDGQLWLTTLRYRYQWQEEEDDGTWLVRWDYLRHGGPPHLHVRGGGLESQPNFHKLHIPTRRVAIEDVVRFLLAERHCESLTSTWSDLLDEAILIFEAIHRRETQ
jgi:Family of unknown function (DUF6516)